MSTKLPHRASNIALVAGARYLGKEEAYRSIASSANENQKRKLRA
jgi:hypothetical protein